MLKIIKQSRISRARRGRLNLVRGAVATPFFMPIATKGAVKNLESQDLLGLGAEIILANSYHLYLRPGLKVLNQAGGLGKFISWPKPILTDSGGFQVFSLAKIRKLTPAGVEFQSPRDGQKHFFTPEKVLKIQEVIGSDIAMALDVCPDARAPEKEIARAVELTGRWARKTKVISDRRKNSSQLIFGIVQGGIFKKWRRQSLEELVKLDFDGYAVGGLAVGETSREMYRVLDYLVPGLPANRPRYLMGVGRPENLVAAVKRGIDMFDCVIPTREARHGRLYLRTKSARLAARSFYRTINIAKKEYAGDFSPINSGSLNRFSKAYLHHLFRIGEPLAGRLATLNNLEFYLKLMEEIRVKITRDEL